MSNHLKNIAIVGGTGNAGGFTTSELLKANFNVTAITRTESPSIFPDGVKVHKGDYNDAHFLEGALKGQDALVIFVSHKADKEMQNKVIDAAANAGVQWILPNEWGSDSGVDTMVDPLPMIKMKRTFLRRIEERGKNWIGVCSGCWYDFSLNLGAWMIDVRERTVTLCSDGATKCSTSTLPQVGRGVAKILSLPVTSASGGPSLSDYKNQYVFIESFQASQREMLDAVNQVQGWTDADWKIEKRPVDEVVEGGKEMLKNGNFQGMRDVLYGLQFQPNSGSNFHHKVINPVIGLEDEEIIPVTKRVMEEVKAGKKYGY